MSKLKAIEVHRHLLGLDGGWVNHEKTVDRFIAGDPQTTVRGIAVGWMGYLWALKEAYNKGCNMFITHEPIYYSHPDKQDPSLLELPQIKHKQEFIQRNNLVILRCHDVWDQLPGWGITDSWGKFLGLGDPIEGQGYFRVYNGGGISAVQIAGEVAKRTYKLDQDIVQFIGPEDRKVNRIVIGTGAMTPFFTFVRKYQADLGICADDGFLNCFQGAFAIDAEIPMIVVNHTVSEEPGVQSLAKYLRQKFKQVSVFHIPQKCSYKNIQSNLVLEDHSA